MKTLVKISTFTSKYVAGIALLVTAIALIQPAAFLWVQPSWINQLLMVVMFGMGLTIKSSDFSLVFSQPKDVLIGVASQFTIMSFLAFVLTRLFGIPQELAIGVVLVGSAPGGTSSNVMTFLANGDVPLSVTITSISTLLAPFLTPLLVYVYLGQTVEVNVMNMFISIVQIVLAPIALGLVCNKLLFRFTQKLVEVLPLVSVVAVLTIIGAIVSRNAANVLTSGLLVLAVVIIHNLLGYCVGFGVAKLFKRNNVKSTTVAIEVGMQNSALATALATTHFAVFPLAAIPGVLFSIVQTVTGAVFANFMSARNQAEKEADKKSHLKLVPKRAKAV
ncbi:MAG: bile acid:sodium symporter family protein [Turicibacter sp.]|nr:bile acid:sodium symporter family protein [Turicibacter sp.]